MAHRPLIARRLAAWCAAVLVGAGIVAAGTISASADQKEEFTLAPGDSRNFANPTPQAADPLLILSPANCRAYPHQASCDVYRLRLKLDDSPDALNFVRISVTYATPATPNLGAVAAGLNPIGTVNYTIYVYDRSVDPKSPKRLNSDDIGGDGIQIPERAAWIADVDDYDIVIQNQGYGPSTGYKMNIQFSNEKFTSPFEALDPATQKQIQENFEKPVDRSADAPPAETPVEDATPVGAVSTDFAGQGISAIGGNVVAPDADFNGFRGGVDNALAGNVAALASNRVPQVRIGKSPPAAIIAFWLLLVPILLLLAFAYWLRRRRPVALQG